MKHMQNTVENGEKSSDLDSFKRDLHASITATPISNLLFWFTTVAKKPVCTAETSQTIELYQCTASRGNQDYG